MSNGLSDATLNQGKIWSMEEKRDLLIEIKNNMSLSDIARRHGRAEEAIITRLRFEYFEMMALSKKTALSTLHFLSPSQINEFTPKEDFRVLWEFKIFMQTKYDFDTGMHAVFDEFVNYKLNKHQGLHPGRMA